VDDVLAALAEQHAELAGILPTDEPGWRRPTPCEGWAVADVVLHLTQTDELAVASVDGRWGDRTGGFGGGATVDDAADAMVAAHRGESGAVVGERWRAGADALRAALAGCDPHARVPWVAGRLSARTLTTTRLAEAWIHTGDVAAGTGVTLEPTDRLRHIARLAWRTLPYAFSRADRTLTGPVAFVLTGPSGEEWALEPDDGPAVTTIRGDATELCLVAGRRVDPTATGLRGEGPDADAVLALVRTYA
jgi:uncharacterized protein (TIGR03084 family)